MKTILAILLSISVTYGQQLDMSHWQLFGKPITFKTLPYKPSKDQKPDLSDDMIFRAYDWYNRVGRFIEEEKAIEKSKGAANKKPKDKNSGTNVCPGVTCGVISSNDSERSVIIKSVAYDPDGSIVYYKWSQLSGPKKCIIVSPGKAITEVKGLDTLGDYVFKIVVTDNNGDTASDTTSVTNYPYKGNEDIYRRIKAYFASYESIDDTINIVHKKKHKKKHRRVRTEYEDQYPEYEPEPTRTYISLYIAETVNGSSKYGYVLVEAASESEAKKITRRKLKSDNSLKQSSIKRANLKTSPLYDSNVITKDDKF